MPAADAATLLERNATGEQGSRAAIRFGDQQWTHADYLTECRRWQSLFASALQARPSAVSGDSAGRPLHVGVFLDNTPDYLFALGGAALGGSTIVGLNHTRSREALLRDITHTHVDLLITEPRHSDQLVEALEVDHPDDQPPVILSERYGEPDGGDGPGDSRHRSGSGWVDIDEALDSPAQVFPASAPRVDEVTAGTDVPASVVNADTRWALIFTSGTSSDPKAVICSQRRLLVTGARMKSILDIHHSDVGYVCMPLFHSNALMVGWASSLVAGASVALARRFSVSNWLPDIRRYNATYFNYTGKPLSYLLSSPEKPDDADNPLRVAFGNEGSPEVLSRFGERFGVKVIDAFGSTEGAIAVNRDVPTRRGAMGVAGESILVVDAEGEPCPPAEFDPEGVLVNPAEAVGEIVNTAGGGPFEGYYNNPEATSAALRDGWYWSGDLGYFDSDRYLYFAGRTSDWIRVGGENFPAVPIEESIIEHNDVISAAVYGVPDHHSGDQVMAALVLTPEAVFNPVEFADWLDSSSGLPRTWRPKYLRISTELPGTGTNKIMKRQLALEKYRPDRCGGDPMWHRSSSNESFDEFGDVEAESLKADLTQAGRARFWQI